MKILRYWGSHFKSYRQVGLVVEQFRPMVQRGWECHLFLEREPDDSDWLAELKTLGVRIHLEPRPSRKLDLRCISRVARLCRGLQPDVFVCENIHDSPLIGAAIARIPVRVWTKNAMNSAFELGSQPSLRNRLALTIRLSCALATRVFAVSSAVRDELVGLGVSAEKVLIRPNPRGLGKVGVTKNEDVRRSLNLSDTDVVWTSVGHAVPVKGWDMLIRAFHRVAESDARAKLLLVGGLERPEERETADFLRSEIERLGLGGKVRLTGHVEDIASLLWASDAFVMSSHSEGFSIALIEALEAGLPCVATRVGIAPDVIRHGFNGMLVDRFNEKQLAEALIELTCDDSLRARLTENSGVPEIIPTLEEYALRMAEDFAALRNSQLGSGKRSWFHK
jgi:glycosyltransferase involved in cell wall biosynthesis